MFELMDTYGQQAIIKDTKQAEAKDDQPADSRQEREIERIARAIREAREREAASQTSTADAPEPVVETPATVPARPRPQSGFTLAALPTADELVANGQLQMAALHLDIHVYSDEPAERFVFINMVRHREKSRLAEGPVVQEITPEGVILDYRGTRFLLPRE